MGEKIIPHCGACGQVSSRDHHCIEGDHMLHVTHWFFEKLEDVGHDLGWYTRRVRVNLKAINDYAEAVATDMKSSDRVILHERVCTIIGADRSKFKPFESDNIWHLPTVEQAKKLLWNAILEHLWTYTTLHKQTKKDYATIFGYRERYLGKHRDLINVFKG